MEGMPNRKQRRLLAKEAGLLKKKTKATFAEKLEMSKRANQFGKQIHFQNVERNLRAQDQTVQDKEQEFLEHLMADGKTAEEALKILQEENDKLTNGNMDSIGKSERT